MPSRAGGDVPDALSGTRPIESEGRSGSPISVLGVKFESEQPVATSSSGNRQMMLHCFILWDLKAAGVALSPSTRTGGRPLVFIEAGGQRDVFGGSSRS